MNGLDLVFGGFVVVLLAAFASIVFLKEPRP